MKLHELFPEISLNPASAKDIKQWILQLAVEGKLTKKWRDSSNSTQINELAFRQDVKKIKHKLLLENNLKFEQSNINDKPKLQFELPRNWCWFYFNDLAIIQRGGSPRPITEYLTDDINGINWIKIGDTKGDDKYIYSSKEKIKKEGIKHSRLVREGDFLLTNSMSFGRPYISKTSGCIHDGWLLIRTSEEIIDQDFLYYLLSSSYIYQSFKDSAAGAVVQNLNIVKVKETLLPIPSLPEQKVIVSIIKELFKEVDELAAQAKQRIELKRSYAVAALNRLCEADTATEWQQMAKVFPEIFNDKQTIKTLRETILQLAVQGKLTAKWRSSRASLPTYQTAHELLAQIKAEKAQLIKEKKIKAEKPLPAIEADEIPFELPEGWVWCRLGEVCEIKGGKRVPAGYQLLEIPTEHVYIRVTDMKNGSVNKNNLRYISKEIFEQIKNYTISKNDIYITIAGTIGSVGKIPDELDGMNLTENAAKIIFKEIDKSWLINTLNSIEIQKQFINEIKQMAQPKLALNKIANCLIPLTTIKEQQIIVEKVNALMGLCDELEKGVEGREKILQNI
jgi:type I restriction enzyme S subunit